MNPGAGAVARRKTPTVNVGGVLIGSEHPVVVQSMTNTDTEDIRSTATQIAELARAGSELVRITVNTENAAASVPGIMERLQMMSCDVPVVGVPPVGAPVGGLPLMGAPPGGMPPVVSG